MNPTSVLTAMAACLLLFSCTADDVKDIPDRQKSYDVIVVGAGGGGLAAAARLSEAGKSVLVIEQHDKPGGYMTSFRRGDYRFEVSLHAIDGLDPGGLSHEFFHKIGIYDRITPVRLDPLYRTVYPNLTMDVPADADAYARRLKKAFPGEAEGIDDLFAAFNRIHLAMEAGMHYMRGDVLSGLWGSVRRPRCLHALLRCWDDTAAEMIGRYIRNERLIDVFTQLSGFLGGGPDEVSAPVFAAMWNSYHRDGYYYVKGGSQAIADAMAAVVKENGGRLLLSTRVTKIIVEDGAAAGVRTDDGRQYRSRFVISNANAPDTLFKLVGRNHLPADYVSQVENMEIAASAFVVYLGVDHNYRDCFPETHELFVNTAADGGEALDFGALRSENIDIEKIPYTIANYSMVNPGNAPDGKNVICLTTLLPYDWEHGWYEEVDYDKYTRFKNRIGRQLVERAEKFLPDLGGHTEVMEVGSPRTMEHYTSNPKGSILGWANTPEQSMTDRLSQKTPIDNLFLAGAWTFPCGGQSAVIMSGIFAADNVLARTN